jgi:hypothetical protein
MADKVEESGPVRVPRQVLGQLEELRDAGYVNMLDRATIIILAEALSLDAAAEWVRANPRPYIHGIFKGFVAED